MSDTLSYLSLSHLLPAFLSPLRHSSVIPVVNTIEKQYRENSRKHLRSRRHHASLIIWTNIRIPIFIAGRSVSLSQGIQPLCAEQWRWSHSRNRSKWRSTYSQHHQQGIHKKFREINLNALKTIKLIMCHWRRMPNWKLSVECPQLPQRRHLLRYSRHSDSM